jgi:hypothetical protein
VQAGRDAVEARGEDELRLGQRGNASASCANSDQPAPSVHAAPSIETPPKTRRGVFDEPSKSSPNAGVTVATTAAPSCVAASVACTVARATPSRSSGVSLPARSTSQRKAKSKSGRARPGFAHSMSSLAASSTSACVMVAGVSLRQ